MVKEFESLEEIQKYYDKETDTYVFKENDKYIDIVIFNFDLKLNANIKAHEIRALNINCLDIDVNDIKAWNVKVRDIIANNVYAHDIIANNVYDNDIIAWDITAKDISYFSVCFARGNIKCRSIKSNYPNAKHFVLNGELEVGEN